VKQGLSQSQGLRQELKINPRLYQAMDLLYMPLLDLQQHLKQELLTNPFLELQEPGDEEETEGEEREANEEGEASTSEAESAEEPAKLEADPNDETDWEGILLDGFDVGGMREEREDREYHEPITVDRKGLADHLRDQVALLDLSPRQVVLADEFIGNIDDDGYLKSSLDAIVAGVNDMVRQAAAELESREPRAESRELPLYTLAEAEHMLGIIQNLDPPGVGARDLRECLMLQLRESGHENSVPHMLVRDCFEEFINHRWNDISRRVSISPAEVQKAADEIQKLDPKPGLRFTDLSQNYITPDMHVEKLDGKYRVTLNDGNLPRLRLSKTYQDIARDKKKFDGESKEFISQKLNSAQWMIQAIEQRRQTMLKVMNYIVERQREYFEKGVQGLKPLTLREVAEVIGMHESTVSRVTNEKFVQTPRGVLPLKFFFSSGLSTADGEDVSARGIRDKIEKLVKEEDAKSPLTDQAIVSILKQDGVQIARRTVAKYRDQLGVLSARMRKRI
jgi:RNA polymerase sigma-54 factor